MRRPRHTVNPAGKIDARAPFPASDRRRKANSSLTFATSCNEPCADEYFPGLTRPGFSLIHTVYNYHRPSCNICFSATINQLSRSEALISTPRAGRSHQSAFQDGLLLPRPGRKTAKAVSVSRAVSPPPKQVPPPLSLRLLSAFAAYPG